MKKLKYCQWIGANMMGVKGGENMYIPTRGLIMSLFALPDCHRDTVTGSIHVFRPGVIDSDAILFQKKYKTVAAAKRGVLMAAKRILKDFTEGITIFYEHSRH